MNEIQILAVLAMVSMSIPAALAFLFWRERNHYIDELYEADQQYYALLKEVKFWKHLATGDDVNRERQNSHLS